MHPRSNSVADSHKNRTADYPTQRNTNKQKGHILQTQHQLIKRDGVRAIKLMVASREMKKITQNRNKRTRCARNQQKQKQNNE